MNSAKWIPRHKLLFWYTKERNWKIVQCFLVWPHKCTPSPPLPPLSLPPPSLPPPSLSPHVGSMQATWFQWGQPTVNAGRVWCGDRAYMDGWCHVYRKWTESRSLPVQWLGKPQLCPPWRCWCRLWRYIYGPQATTLCTHCETIYILVITLFSSIPCVTQSLIVTMLIMCLIMYLIIYLIMYLIIYLLMYLIIFPKGKRCATMIVINCYTSDSLVGATIF